MNANAMYQFVAVALLDNGSIIDPIPLAGGVVGGSGYRSVESKSALVKTSGANALGKWPDNTKGYLTYYFDTHEPIQDILIGTYADYADSNYKKFLSSGVSLGKGEEIR